MIFNRIQARSGQWAAVTILLVVLLVACQTRIDPDTAAMVNGRAITMVELDEAAKSWESGAESGTAKPLLRLEALRRLIEESLIVGEAGRRGLRVSNEELEARLAEIKADFPGRTFEELLIKEYVGYDDWKKKLRTHILIRKTTSASLQGRIKSDPGEWRRFYEDQQRSMPDDRRYKVRHITTPDLAEAEAVLGKIEAGQDFDQAAQQVLGDVAGELMGEAIWVYPDRLPGRHGRSHQRHGTGPGFQRGGKRIRLHNFSGPGRGTSQGQVAGRSHGSRPRSLHRIPAGQGLCAMD